MTRTFVQHLDHAEFKPGALVGAESRDLGIGAITDGTFNARLVRPVAEQKPDWHRHEAGFSMTVVLQGEFDVEYQEIGLQHLRRGDVTFSWNGPVHRELACRGDVELLVVSTSRQIAHVGGPRVVVQHAADAPFEDGLRDYFLYRDLGIARATQGDIGAHMIKVTPGKHPHGQWHTHALGFQFVYITAGWVEFNYEDIGVVRLRKGSVVYQPPMVRHAEVAHSDDVQIIEIVSPAEFATDVVTAPHETLATAPA